jgi:hypothetical protein
MKKKKTFFLALDKSEQNIRFIIAYLNAIRDKVQLSAVDVQIQIELINNHLNRPRNFLSNFLMSRAKNIRHWINADAMSTRTRINSLKMIAWALSCEHRDHSEPSSVLIVRKIDAFNSMNLFV